jgi:hypothetical protein
MISSSDTICAAVGRTLQYYAFFRFPLRATEIWQYSSTDRSAGEITEYLDEQVLTGKLFQESEYYALTPDVATLVERRLRGAQQAARELKMAKRVAGLIHCFPFVRFVGISGSLSKGFADSDSDFDFFIITAPGRLWICRSLLHAFKKLSFLFGQQHKFCMNYFLDQGHVELEDRNVYVATELCTMIPVRGREAYSMLMMKNAWRRCFLPNYSSPAELNEGAAIHPLKRCGELLFEICIPAKLNEALMRFTDRKWRRKWAAKGFPESDYDTAFRTRIHVSKNHQMNYQKRVLAALKPGSDD